MGTPRPTLLQEKPSKDVLKSWTSFDESPVHAGDGAHKEEGWMSFKESPSPINQNEFNNSMTISSPAVGYTAKSRLPTAPQHQTIAPVTPIQESSILNRTGIGTDKQQTPLSRAKANVKHPHSEVATHGPGSTINHLLRHKAGDVDTESMTDNSKLKENNRLVGDSIIRASNSSGKEVHKPAPEASNYRQPSKRGNGNLVSDPWFVTEEQGKYYKNQFASMQQKLDGKIDGQTARNFFTKSRLPIPELSHIWELCDMDQDGHLTLLEFCAAFHLVVARKNGFDLPSALPESLLPPLTKMFGQAANLYSSLQKTPVPSKSAQDDEQAKAIVVQSPVKSKSNSEASKESSDKALPRQMEDFTPWVSQQDKWETFSDRTSSSTNLANFDQNLGQNDNLPHPVALRITPSRHEMHSAKMRKDKDLAKSTDDEERNQLKYTVPPSHKSLTNPYGSLKNDFSEPDSHASPMARSSSHSSCSSGGTSDRSMSEIDRTMKQGSDQESDWSSRPLQPRSASDSSIASSLDAVDGVTSGIRNVPVTPNVPTPPPRPHQQVKSSKSDSIESDSYKSEDSKIQSLSAPTPPPRPQQTTQKKPLNQTEEFADFSRFNNEKTEELSSKQTANATSESSRSRAATGTTDSSDEIARPLSEEECDVKPTPAPRYNREEKTVIKEPKEESSPERSAHRKAPTKPPRGKGRSIGTAGDDPSPKIMLTSPLASQNDDLPAIAEKPPQNNARSKTDIQQSIRNLKCRNTKLTKLNADLQQELKNVMQSRITVEMSIHQLRPFTQ